MQGETILMFACVEEDRVQQLTRRLDMLVISSSVRMLNEIHRTTSDSPDQQFRFTLYFMKLSPAFKTDLS